MREIKEDLYEDFIYRLMLHIRRVQDNMIILDINRDKLPFDVNKGDLLYRGLQHDVSKCCPECLEGYIACHEFYRNKKLKLPTGHINMDDFNQAWKIHSEELHHPEGKTHMLPIDIIEMCCDIVAMAQEFKEPYDEYYKNVMIEKFPVLKDHHENILKIIRLLEKNIG